MRRQPRPWRWRLVEAVVVATADHRGMAATGQLAAWEAAAFGERGIVQWKVEDRLSLTRPIAMEAGSVRARVAS